MTPLAFIDLYCERTAPGFWNEPVNAISNIGFVIAATFAWRVSQKRKGVAPDFWEISLFVLAALIGVGSFLFHTFANSYAELADVIPIWSFVALYVFVVIYRSTGEDVHRTVRIAAIALFVTGTVFWFTSDDIMTDAHSHDHGPGPFNGSLQYLPALVALIIFSLITALRHHPARRMIVFATAAFSLSLVMRTIDHSVCDLIGIGTHFLWHILNAVMVGLLLVTLVREYPPSASIR
ncbi:ceramidase domain-containing protein [uncultured Tateyamaria sp.]|uniref:ceramidase domain-containing protein n=1 Tax=uncultured Tateyamaria sp. TaxID=455651 RepID=UPI0026080E37|nr:ceramidase domain-containing protein [uncultured Tateyamaria sp.]